MFLLLLLSLPENKLKNIVNCSSLLSHSAAISDITIIFFLSLSYMCSSGTEIMSVILMVVLAAHHST